MPKNCIADRKELEAFFLPTGRMLQIDRVMEVSSTHVWCEMDLAGHWVFPLHFPSDPVFPASLLIEAAGQAVAISAWHAGLRGRPRLARVAARFEMPVLPHDRTICFKGIVRQRKTVCSGRVDVMVNGSRVAQITPMIIILSSTDVLPAAPEVSHVQDRSDGSLVRLDIDLAKNGTADGMDLQH